MKQTSEHKSAVQGCQWTRLRNFSAGISLILTLAFLSGACGFEMRDAPASFKSFSQSRDMTEVKELRANLELPVGELNVDSLPSNDKRAFQLDVDYNDYIFEPSVKADTFGSVMDMRFQLRHLRRSYRTVKSHADFHFNRNLPLELNIKTGVGENRVDVSQLKIRELRVKAGVGELELTATEPGTEECHRIEFQSGVGKFEAVGLGNLNFQSLDFQGGVGETTLDLTGNWKRNADVDVKVGIGEINIVLPSSVGAEVYAPKNFLSGLNLRDFTKEQGNTYRSNNYNSAPYRLRFDVKSGIGSVNFRWK